MIGAIINVFDFSETKRKNCMAIRDSLCIHVLHFDGTLTTFSISAGRLSPVLLACIVLNFRHLENCLNPPGILLRPEVFGIQGLYCEAVYRHDVTKESDFYNGGLNVNF